jgi:hypothetical protein
VFVAGVIHVRAVSAVIVAGMRAVCLRGEHMGIVIHLVIAVAHMIVLRTLMVVRVSAVRHGVVLMVVVF